MAINKKFLANAKEKINERCDLSVGQLLRIVELSDGNKAVSNYIDKIIARSERRKKKDFYYKKAKKSVVYRMQKIEESAERFQKQLIKNATPSELGFKNYLDKWGTEYEFQKIFYNKEDDGKNFYIADFYISNINCIIEIDGGYHYEGDQYLADKDRDELLKKNGIDAVYRLDNLDILNEEYCKNKLSNMHNERLNHKSVKILSDRSGKNTKFY